MRLFLLAYAYFLFLLRGVCYAISPDPPAVDWILSILLAFIMVMLCQSDARQRQKPLTRSLGFVMLITWPLAVPAYLIWSRGWKGLWLTLLHALLLYLTFVFAFVLSSWLFQ